MYLQCCFLPTSRPPGHYVKDLSLLNREIQQTIIVDNSPMSYIFHPENAIDCSSFFDDPTDVELWQVRLRNALVVVPRPSC